ncbi:hypothetical protein EGK75_13900 [Neisseria weixii]|uniref:Uncharacterized protein n=1 Tax=Neisseria weixii TaxID=1853276 RepID=A0A3N4MHN3_9NEIS|nr:hypothetical protein [Neisseria weixii]RPD83079.1 hypothetical protein EGK75_13900 [Neisseria weixii]RPD83114.1 hypothetical protein EGK74_13425 [Neisseria weixii]
MGIQSQLIDQLKGRLYLSSDYAVAQRWQIEPTRVSQYRRDRLRLPLRFVVDIAEQTEQDALILLQLLDRHRAKNAEEIIRWKPNENVRRYAPAWVKRRNYHRKA